MRIDMGMMSNSYVSIQHGDRDTEGKGIQSKSFMEALLGVKSGRSRVQISEEKKVPYAHLAKDGIINYNGVTFVCDNLRNQLCLGEVSNLKDCIRIPMAEGGSLVVNRDNLEELSQAIGMFSPEDVNRIMRAIAQDTKCQQMQQEIEKEKNSIGEAAERI